MSGCEEPAEGTGQRASRSACPAKLGEQIRPAILSVLVLTLLTGCAFPLLLAAIGPAAVPAPGQREPDRARGSCHRIGAHRAGILAAGILSIPAIGGRQRLRWYFVRRDQPWPQPSQAHERRCGFRGHPATGQGIPPAQLPGARRPDSHRCRDALGERARSRHHPGQCRAADSAGGAPAGYC